MALKYLKMTWIFVTYCCVPSAQAEEMTLMMSSGDMIRRGSSRDSPSITQVCSHAERAPCVLIWLQQWREAAQLEMHSRRIVPFHFTTRGGFRDPGFLFQAGGNFRLTSNHDEWQVFRAGSWQGAAHNSLCGAKHCTTTLFHVRGCFPLQGCANREVNSILTARKRSM